MQRTSESIASIAAALAQAQADLSNPEKSLVATIRPASTREPERTFRYAPLASGLDLIRKSLGKHEIATIQTTTIDKETGLVRLTTVLAHSSGEWVSSEWPVCPISDTGSPQRMGAALTYARRYALFALVGIAGEDDLDAPDLTQPQPGPVLPHAGSSNGRGGPEIQSMSGSTSDRAAASRSLPPSAKSILKAAASASLRDQLLVEIQSLTSSDEAVAWARRSLPTKNTLTADHAQIIETTFQAKISTFPDDQVGSNGPGGANPSATEAGAVGDIVEPVNSAPETATPAADRSATCHPITKPRRIRDERHRKYVSTQACLVCGRQPADAHHLRFAQPRAMGRKASDEFTVPLCRIHHRQLHQAGDEIAWWEALKIDPMQVAGTLWQKSRRATGD
jgi:hypothetical protein